MGELRLFFGSVRAHSAFLILGPYKHSYLLTGYFRVDNYLWQFYRITFKTRCGLIFPCGGFFLPRDAMQARP